MARVTHPGQKTFWHLRDRGRVPSAYEIASTRLSYVRPPRFEVDTPLAAWYERNQQGSPVKLEDWDAFADPAATTYAAYVARRRDDEAFLERLLEGDDVARLFRGEQRERTRALYRRGVAPLRFPCHALQMSAAYVAHLAPGSRVSIAATFQSADELRRVQRLAHRLRQVELADEPLAAASRAAWQDDPAWQPLRRVCETLLVTYDFGEALAALNLVVKPAFDALVLCGLARSAEALGDSALARLLGAFEQDGAWHRDWSVALARTLSRERAENRAAIRRFVAEWRPRIREAAAALGAALFDAAEPARAALARHEKEVDSILELGTDD